MSAIFGETLTFLQENGPEVRLVVFGDEFYARFENTDGYAAVYDTDLGLFCYALLREGTFVSSGVPITEQPPPEARRHLQESETVRRQVVEERRLSSVPPPPIYSLHDTMQTFGQSQGLLPGRRLSTGAVRGLTVLVDFQDVTSTVTRADVSEMLNGQNYTKNGNFCSAREYFRLVSDGKLDYSNEVVGPFKLSRTLQFYTTNLLVKEALDLAVASGVDLAEFDSRGEGIVDALNFMYAGQTQYLGHLWPHNSHLSLRYGNMRTDLYLLTSMGRSSADLSIGTFCHENGHLLCRFPDMYDYGEREGDAVKSAGIGYYCLMGSGNHLNRGRTPSPVCGYLRDLAGWCEEEVLLNDPGKFEAVHGDYGTVMKFETDKLNEYFIVENRSKIGLDQHLPSSGLAVYHCDTLGSNEFQGGTPSRHYQCALLQADGHLDLELNPPNQGDSTDLFGAISGTALSHLTNPSSRQWDGADSLLTLSDIGAPGTSIKFTAGQQADTGSVRGEASPGLRIPDDDPGGVSSKIALDHSGTAKHIEIEINITHTYISDLIVEIVGPSGRRAILHDQTGEGRDNLVKTYDSAAVQALGTLLDQPVRGDWILHVRDVVGKDIGTLNQWSIDIGLEAAGDPVIRAESIPNLQIPDNDPLGVGSVITIEQGGTIRRAKVGIEITHTYIGDLRVELLAPSSRRTILHSRLGRGQDDLIATYDTTSSSVLAPFIGEPTQGNWVLRVADLAGRDVGTLRKWSLELDTGGQ